MDAKDALDSIRRTVVFSSRDWAREAEDAWLYGIVIGWDCEDGCDDNEDCSGAMESVSIKHGWSADEVERLRDLRRAYRALAGEGPRVITSPARIISEEEYAEFARRWRVAYEDQRHITAVDITRAFDVPASWVSQEAWVAAKTTRRPWWQRWFA